MTALKVLAAILCALIATGWSHGSAPGSQTVPSNISVPLLTGTFTVGGSLSSSTGGWSGCSGTCTFTYLFYREGTAQGTRNATSTYAPATADLSSRMSVDVVATNSFGASSPALSAVSQPIDGSTICYVSLSDGNDSNDCTTSTPGMPHGPIQTIAALNAKSIAAGTSVKLKRGDKWDRSAGPTVTSTIAPTNGGASGNPIVYDAYGTGALPTIDGSADASTTGAWTNIGTNLWQSVQTFPPITNVAVTFTGSPGNPINVIWGTQLPYANGSVVFAGSSLPTGLNAAQTYYILSPSGNSFQISLTPGGAAINAGASLGSGTTAGVSGFPYGNANDVGNILWNFATLGGSAPAEVKKANFGKMTGGGAGGVWYLPGDGTANLGTTQGNWNFNTDNFRVQIYSVGNPATAMPGLRLALDGYFVNLFATNNNSTFQNINFQNTGGASGIDIIASNITVRDCVIQWVGGSNVGGASTANSRAGDGMNPKNTYNNILMERNYIYQVYDVDISPQLASPGMHDNVTIRNNIFHKFGTAFGTSLMPGATSTQNGLYIYNNTAYSLASWSANQRPNPGSAHVYGLSFGIYDTFVTATNTNVINNAWGGVGPLSAGGFGMINKYLPDTDLAFLGVGTWDYNLWRTTDGTATEFGQTGSPIPMHNGNITYAAWRAASYGGNGIFDTHGLIDIDPGFTNPSVANFTPTSSSPLRSAGTNLYNAGVVWDFFRNPRPSSGNFTIGAIQQPDWVEVSYILQENSGEILLEDGTGALIQ